MEFDPKRSLYLNGEIDTQTSMGFISGITKLYAEKPAELITLFLASSGGSVSDTFAIYEYVIKALKPRLQTVALGEASSMAVLLFLMGDTRYVGELTVMRFHHLGRVLQKDARFTPEMAGRTKKELRESEHKYIKILTERTSNRITRAIGLSMINKERTVSASQAVELGLAHHIL